MVTEGSGDIDGTDGSGDLGAVRGADGLAGERIRTEARWPVLLAVLAVMTLTLLRPDEIRSGAPIWLLPASEVVLLLIIVARHPEQFGPRHRLLRAISIAIVGIVGADTLVATAELIRVLIAGGEVTNSASLLLAAGGIVWGSNILAYALLYWLVDGGGAAVRAHRMSRTLDLAFPQQLNPEVAPTGWRPRFFDYLYYALTASTAFSPTDVMPLVPWAKAAISVQSLTSLAILGLVVARAINVLT